MAEADINLTMPKNLQRKPGDKIVFQHPMSKELSGSLQGHNSDTNWIIDTMKEHFKKGDFYGSITMKIQASQIQTIHVTRTYVKPEKQEMKENNKYE